MDVEPEESSENFFISFTDLLVGVIFMFILLLMVFAVNLKDPDPPKPVIISERIRANVLTEIAARMEARGMPVKFDVANGVVRLPESLLFASGQWQLLPEGQKTVEALALVLKEILPCSAKNTKPCDWKVQPLTLDSVLIEGHTDNRPFSNAQGFTNWELSAFRAITVYRTMVAVVPELDQTITNAAQQPLLGVSAYADRRPASRTALDPNRRIDVRFNMQATGQAVALPTSSTLPPEPPATRAIPTLSPATIRLP